MSKVLIVDDSPTLSAMFRKFFAREGHEVLEAGDGRRALELAKAERPDLMVLDNMLPEINGFDVCRLLKADEQFKSIKILLLTGSKDEASMAIGKKTGADIYLTKDCGLAHVFEVAGALLEDGVPK